MVMSAVQRQEIIKTLMIIGGLKAVGHLMAYGKMLYNRKSKNELPSEQDVGMAIVLMILGTLILLSDGGKKYLIVYLPFMIGTLVTLQYPAMHDGMDMHAASIVLLVIGTLGYLGGLYGIKAYRPSQLL